MNEIKLNLARKWRSRTFDQLVSQELPVRILKNSLYLNHFFPVYLFSGQKGCGKTTAARIFATAVNCQELNNFQKNPKIVVPCLQCRSCLAMKEGNHPDFIEIDAASHTGVDNVRDIIQAATFMPILGFKKIYLIDEAHMLSKAAFNAFLKILEEPPATVFFILATTDPHKIIETVTSRCFQVFFKALDFQALSDHLQMVCTHENIPYQKDALLLLAKQADGSARDALNLLEQVRFATEIIDTKSIYLVLGHIEKEELIKLMMIIVKETPQELINFLKKINIKNYSALFLWNSSIEILHEIILYLYGIVNKELMLYESLIKEYSPNFFVECLEIFYQYELVFLKTRFQHNLLEYIFLLLSYKKSTTTVSGNVNSNVLSEKKEQVDTIKNSTNFLMPEWGVFLEKIQVLDDPLVQSIFKQAVFSEYKNNIIVLTFPENFAFYNDLLNNSMHLWQPMLYSSFAQEVKLEIVFSSSLKNNTILKNNPIIKNYKNENASSQDVALTQPIKKDNQYLVKNKSNISTLYKKSEKIVDISDQEKWKKTNNILKMFPGVVAEVPKDEHE